MIDAILSYHMNPATCGVAKFNCLLARKLGLPFLHCYSPEGRSCEHPLVSIKPSEMPFPADVHWKIYDLFLHDRTLTADAAIVQEAQRTLYADVVGCPSTLEGDATRAPLNILTFGMAHKLQVPHLQKLKRLLDEHGQEYTVCLSTAVHEGGSPWWKDVSEAHDTFRTIWGERARILGYLADDALAKELRECSAAAMFFDPALRANNTTFWAAMEAGAVVITNLDAESPVLRAEDRFGNRPAVQTWADINTMNRWPAGLLDALDHGRCQPTVPRDYGWEQLLALITR